jgi:hypothetical protein
VKKNELVMIWNYHHLKKWNTEFTRNQDIFKNSYLLKDDEEKKNSCTWTTIIIYYNKMQKKLFQNSFIWTSFFWQKRHVVFFPIIPLVHYIPFAPWSSFFLNCLWNGPWTTIWRILKSPPYTSFDYSSLKLRCRSFMGPKWMNHLFV